MSMIRFAHLVSRTSDGAVPDGYDGFHWSNFGVAGDLDPAIGPASGFLNDIYKNHWVAFNEGGHDATMSRDTPFTLKQALIAGGWNDGLRITATGYLHGVQVVTETFGVNTNQNLIYFSPQFHDIDSVTFHSQGGTHHAGYTGSGTEFAIDNIVWG
jgi:hypothetical protein